MITRTWIEEDNGRFTYRFVHDFIDFLEAHGYVVREGDFDDDEYHPGTDAFEIGQQLFEMLYDRDNGILKKKDRDAAGKTREQKTGEACWYCGSSNLPMVPIGIRAPDRGHYAHRECLPGEPDD